jgi:alpha-amylase
MRKSFWALPLLIWVLSCNPNSKKNESTSTDTLDSLAIIEEEPAFLWENANVYFLLTDRFNNGNNDNDINFERTQETAVLRGFEGGDIQGVINKLDEGYFRDLGITALWLSPLVEQVHGIVDEGTGPTYGYHGYWTRDWTTFDPNFGTQKDFATLVNKAHKQGIRVVMDVVLNHTGPVTEIDSVWPEDWVRTQPQCDYTNYENTTSCTLVANLPDIKTESETAVELPDYLLAKWKKEGRLSQELDELDVFFKRTGYPRAPRYYIIKWLTDYIQDYGVDGFRVDTAKHLEASVWAELRIESDLAFERWKKLHPDKTMGDTPFYMVGEVYYYGVSSGRNYDFGDKKVDYFSNGMDALINFELKTDAQKDYETVFKKYSQILHKELKGKTILNYLSSHDDGQPFDAERKNSEKAANMLLLTPGGSQVYYGDETNRPLIIEGTQGDATLRSFMNWEEVDTLTAVKNNLEHWQKLGQFRKNHLAIGAGRHRRLSQQPYVFSRTYVDGDTRDKVVVGLDLPKGKKTIRVKGFFGNGTILYDTYSDTDVTVEKGNVVLNNEFTTVLLEVRE